jgi:hypothetical protein
MGIARHRCEDNIKMDVKKQVGESANKNLLTQKRDHGRPL